MSIATASTLDVMSRYATDLDVGFLRRFRMALWGVTLYGGAGPGKPLLRGGFTGCNIPRSAEGHYPVSP